MESNLLKIVLKNKRSVQVIWGKTSKDCKILYEKYKVLWEHLEGRTSQELGLGDAF